LPARRQCPASPQAARAHSRRLTPPPTPDAAIPHSVLRSLRTTRWSSKFVCGKHTRRWLQRVAYVLFTCRCGIAPLHPSLFYFLPVVFSTCLDDTNENTDPLILQRKWPFWTWFINRFNLRLMKTTDLRPDQSCVAHPLPPAVWLPFDACPQPSSTVVCRCVSRALVPVLDCWCCGCPHIPLPFPAIPSLNNLHRPHPSRSRLAYGRLMPTHTMSLRAMTATSSECIRMVFCPLDP